MHCATLVLLLASLSLLVQLVLRQLDAFACGFSLTECVACLLRG
jgi:hypothetical protein